jgi:hypothetical protein
MEGFRRSENQGGLSQCICLDCPLGNASKGEAMEPEEF